MISLRLALKEFKHKMMQQIKKSSMKFSSSKAKLMNFMPLALFWTFLKYFFSVGFNTFYEFLRPLRSRVDGKCSKCRLVFFFLASQLLILNFKGVLKKAPMVFRKKTKIKIKRIKSEIKENLKKKLSRNLIEKTLQVVWKKVYREIGKVLERVLREKSSQSKKFFFSGLDFRKFVNIFFGF